MARLETLSQNVTTGRTSQEHSQAKPEEQDRSGLLAERIPVLDLQCVRIVDDRTRETLESAKVGCTLLAFR